MTTARRDVVDATRFQRLCDHVLSAIREGRDTLWDVVTRVEHTFPNIYDEFRDCVPTGRDPETTRRLTQNLFQRALSKLRDKGRIEFDRNQKRWLVVDHAR